MPEALIALGSNVGDRLAFLRKAVGVLAEIVCVRALSAIYETAPMYVTDQPPYLNAAIRIDTNLSPMALLTKLKEIERLVGRHDGRRYGPREIDLDLVGYGALAYRYSDAKKLWLQVPHPRTPERRFVLEPLADIAPEYVLPGLDRVDRLLRQTEGDAETVRRIDDALFPI
ncbi:2-amino-4-hydroxy-6- hydroxymethyldihydropteridine pyrophosphokinase [Fimbriimonas ginsengisoli Gsoil 348]|uniref:2-amino-4-hydroxy-6-hydroxymethyldihydropteridine diphosphokinase n=1 Tax=Fimbriimonas ginsengisoli Gsoil 348 TaxID=661478 RepID=A0A068NU53_FIMGI|nr:2-amino-4-hydroxy-6- hydroxymethyldihydropteridine pyrophosphokinase [Fimbriimonas ginsengisoli Gsoil 348]